MDPVTALVLLNAHVVDANGPRDVAAILIEDGRITHMGELPEFEESVPMREVDLEGQTVLPGLIDMHVHLSLTPSGAFRETDAQTNERQWRTHLKSYVAWGVTTVLDTGILPEHARTLHTYADSQASPELYFLGPILSPPGGYVSVVLPEFPSVATAADVAEQFAAWDDLDPVGVKLTQERGMVTKVWPLYSDEVRAAILDEAAKRDWPLFVHGMSVEEHNLALDMQPKAMVHPVDRSNKKLAQRHVEQGTYVTTTLSVFESNLMEWDLERLDTPMMKLTVPPEELESAKDPFVHSEYKRIVTENVVPNMMFKSVIEKLLAKPAPLEKRGQKMAGHVAYLHEQGVPLLMGSDSGNWPIFAFEFHGPTTIREVELLVQWSGIDPLDVITISTLNPAKALGIDDEVGTVEVGKQADLMIVDGDPLADITALRNISWTVLDGQMQTPTEWMR